MIENEEEEIVIYAKGKNRICAEDNFIYQFHLRFL